MLSRIIGAVAGFLLGALAAFGVGLAAGEIFSISQAEGAYAMGVFFFWTPLGGVLGAIVGAMLGAGSRLLIAAVIGALALLAMMLIVA